MIIHSFIHIFIYSFIFSNHFTVDRIMINPELIPGTLCIRLKYTLDRIPVHHRALNLKLLYSMSEVGFVYKKTPNLTCCFTSIWRYCKISYSYLFIRIFDTIPCQLRVSGLWWAFF